MPLNLEQKNINFDISWAGVPLNNSFSSVVGNNIANDWYSCRESFIDFSMNRMLFCTDVKLRTINFVHLFEKKLKLSKTKFFSTNRKNVLYIEPNSFWTKKYFYKSLFTAILKASGKYAGDFDAAVNSYRYFKITRYALNRFLSGYTKYTGNTANMWFEAFTAYSYTYRKDIMISNDFINKLLVKP